MVSFTYDVRLERTYQINKALMWHYFFKFPILNCKFIVYYQRYFSVVLFKVAQVQNSIILNSPAAGESIQEWSQIGPFILYWLALYFSSLHQLSSLLI